MWSLVPSTARAPGPLAQTGTTAPVCCWLGGAADGAARAAVAGGAVGQAQGLAVLGDEVGRVAGRAARYRCVLGHDLAGVRVVSGDDDQGVGVRLLVVQRDADRLVEGDGLADLAAGVGGVVLLVDRGALDLQEEALACSPAG